MTTPDDAPVVAPAPRRAAVGIGQLLGGLWIAAGVAFVVALLVDNSMHVGDLGPELIAIVLAELAIPVFLGIRLIRRPSARLAKWSCALAVLGLNAAVVFAADSSVSGGSNPVVVPILVGCFALLALSVVSVVRYRAPKLA